MQTYGRLIGKGLAKVAFISFENPVFIHRFAKYGDNYNFGYLADYEFLRYLSALINKPIKEQSQVVILLDEFPEDIQTFLRITPDVVAAFKSLRSDLELDKLCKTEQHI